MTDMATTSTPRRSNLELVLELASATFGYFLSRDARKRGVSPSSLSDLRAHGVIESVAHGINRLVVLPDSWDGRALAALWSGGSMVALSRWAALRVLEGTGGSPSITLVGPRTVRRRAGTVPVRTHVRLTADDICIRGLWRTTSAAFTVCDLAAVTRPDRLLRIADRLVATDLLDLDDLRVMVGRFWAIEGVERLRIILDELSPASRWTRSNGERTWLRLVASADLPALVANFRVTDADGRTRYLDFAWPDLKVAFEIDLHPSHTRTVGRGADGHRQNALVLNGWTVYRFDMADLMLRPDHVVATVAAAFRAAS